MQGKQQRIGIFLPPGEGRSCPMGRISAVFKADGDETERRYSISEWWLEPHTQGPGAHSHAEDDVFYVIEGTMSILVGDRWIDAPRGSFLLAPGGVLHGFLNRRSEVRILSGTPFCPILSIPYFDRSSGCVAGARGANNWANMPPCLVSTWLPTLPAIVFGSP